MNVKFSGHDTFHCKQQWLLKGFKHSNNQGFTNFNDISVSIADLGVGKNMVQSVKYWLEAFDIVHRDGNTKFGEFIFGKNGVDPYLEDEGTLWLLQYKICSRQYATLYNLIFSEYFQDKASLEFTESKIINFVQSFLLRRNIKSITEGTIRNDFKVFIKSYKQAKKDQKTIEEEFNSPLIELNLIEELETDGFRIKKEIRDIPTSVFAFAVLDLLSLLETSSINFRKLQQTIGSYFCLTTEGLDNCIERLTTFSDNFVYNEDGGIAQLQVKKNDEKIRFEILNNYYGI